MSIPLLVLLLLSFAITTAANHDLITKTCTRAAASSPNVHYPFCVSALTASIPKSHKADLTLKQLCLYSLRSLRRNATATRREVKKLLKTYSDPYVESRLRNCLVQYTDAVSGVREVARDVRKGELKDANVRMSAVVDAPGECQEGFVEIAAENPVKEKGQGFFDFAVIPIAIINMLDNSSNNN